MTIIIAIFSFVLVLLCLFTLLVVMVQKPKGDGGMGAALGGGSMEAALGAETSSLLTRITIYAVIGFFVLTFSLYLGNLSSQKSETEEGSESILSEIVDEAAAEASNAPEAESALQQVLDLSGGQEAPAAAEQAEAAGQELEAAAENVEAEVEEKVNQ